MRYGSGEKRADDRRTRRGSLKAVGIYDGFFLFFVIELVTQ